MFPASYWHVYIKRFFSTVATFSVIFSLLISQVIPASNDVEALLIWKPSLRLTSSIRTLDKIYPSFCISSCFTVLLSSLNGDFPIIYSSQFFNGSLVQIRIITLWMCEIEPLANERCSNYVCLTILLESQPNLAWQDWAVQLSNRRIKLEAGREGLKSESLSKWSCGFCSHILSGWYSELEVKGFHAHCCGNWH